MSKFKYGKKLLSVIMAAALIFSCAAITVSAQSDAVEIDFSLYDDGFTIGDMELKVTDGTAEEYGFTVSTADHSGKAVNYVTVFDAVVAASKAYYGDKFTKATAADYLTFSNGYLSKAFGKSTGFSFSVNGKTPNDGIFNENYQSYTGYAIDTAQIKDDDRVEGYFIKDTKFWSDINTFFNKSELETVRGESATLNVSGMSLTYYGCSKEETQKTNTFPMEGVDVKLTKDFKEYTDVGKVDASGNITVKFADDGDFYLVTAGEYTDKAGVKSPIIGDFCKVSVSPSGQCIWIIKSFNVGFDKTGDSEGILTLSFGLKDILSHASDKTVVKSIDINNAFLFKIIDTITGIIG